MKKNSFQLLYPLSLGRNITIDFSNIVTPVGDHMIQIENLAHDFTENNEYYVDALKLFNNKMDRDEFRKLITLLRIFGKYTPDYEDQEYILSANESSVLHSILYSQIQGVKTYSYLPGFKNICVKAKELSAEIDESDIKCLMCDF